MPTTYISIKPHKRINLKHLYNIAIEFYGKPEIEDDILHVSFENYNFLKIYRKIVENYYDNINKNEENEYDNDGESANSY